MTGINKDWILLVDTRGLEKLFNKSNLREDIVLKMEK